MSLKAFLFYYNLMIFNIKRIIDTLGCIAFAIRLCCVILVYQLLYRRGVYEIRCSTQPKS